LKVVTSFRAYYYASMVCALFVLFVHSFLCQNFFHYLVVPPFLLFTPNVGIERVLLNYCCLNADITFMIFCCYLAIFQSSILMEHYCCWVISGLSYCPCSCPWVTFIGHFSFQLLETVPQANV